MVNSLHKERKQWMHSSKRIKGTQQKDQRHLAFSSWLIKNSKATRFFYSPGEFSRKTSFSLPHFSLKTGVMDPVLDEDSAALNDDRSVAEKEDLGSAEEELMSEKGEQEGPGPFEAQLQPQQWAQVSDLVQQEPQPEREMEQGQTEPPAPPESNAPPSCPEPDGRVKWDGESPRPSGDMLPKHPEARRSEEASRRPQVQVVELLSSEDTNVPQSQSLREEGQPSGPSSEQVSMAIEDMKHFMEEFGVDLATVTQAFLKTSGEVAAVVHCLQTGPHSEDCPRLWTRQNDLDLLTGDDHLRSKLIAKYGEEKVKRRVAFRKN